MNESQASRQQGFTLIELSIVLVVIGLIVGGVLVGRDLVSAAGMRSTIAQVERYNQAANTFRGKYGQLPGDMDANTAASFGFAPRWGVRGKGDGNGVIEGACGNYDSCSGGEDSATGEQGTFWSDLTYANGMNVGLVEGSFTVAAATMLQGFSLVNNITGTGIAAYFPPAKIGRGNYIYVWSGGDLPAGTLYGNGLNYFGISAVNAIATANNWDVHSTPALTVKEAYGIDAKMDDGLPQSGRIKARYINFDLQNYSPVWAAGGGTQGTGAGAYNSYTSTTATTGSSTTCFDNSTSTDGQTAVNGTVQHYSVEMNGGTGMNCALSFQFQ